MFRRLALLTLVPVLLVVAGCKLDLRGAREASGYRVHEEVVQEIDVPQGFRAVEIAEGFNYPSSL
ncbi:MAG: hypothetical protein ACM369_06815, partial [Acidobacteriota bacterium]